jgi:hypothetical protein
MRSAVARLGAEQDDRSPRGAAPPPDQLTRPGDDLPYKVELWDQTRTQVQKVLAVTTNATIGYAAFYAATQEFLDHYVTLRHKSSIVARSHYPKH